MIEWWKRLQSFPQHLREDIARVTTDTYGWQDATRGTQMAQIVLEAKPDVVVEIGVYGGRSLFPQALALHENGQGMIYGIDPWSCGEGLNGLSPEEDREWWLARNLDSIHTDFMRHLWLYGLTDYVVPIRAPSRCCADLFTSIDILNIDGAHSEEDALWDAGHYGKKVKSGGYIWFDDPHFDSTKKAMQLLDTFCTLEAEMGTYNLYRVK